MRAHVLIFRYVRVVFTSSCLQDGSCLIYVMFGVRSLPPVVCRRALVLFTLCFTSPFISSCLQAGLMSLFTFMFGSSLSPVVCRTALVLFTLCSLRLYLQLFVGRLLSYLRCVRFVLYLQLIVGGLLSYLRLCSGRLLPPVVCRTGSCLIYVMFASSLSPFVCRSDSWSYLRYVRFVLYLQLIVGTALVLFTLCSLRLYLQLFVGGLLSYLCYVRVVFTSSCL